MKKLLSITLALATLSATCYAEQPKVADYRNIMSSGNYYVEYEYNYAKKILAAQNGKHLDYTMLQSQHNSALAVLGFINPLFAVAGFLGGSEKKVASILYQDGKYYQFESKKKVTMAYYKQLDNPNILEQFKLLKIVFIMLSKRQLMLWQMN